MELLDEVAGPSHGGPSASFRAPVEDRMSIAASEGELESSRDKGLALLRPLRRVALTESDPELTAMLSRAAESVRVE